VPLQTALLLQDLRAPEEAGPRSSTQNSASALWRAIADSLSTPAKTIMDVDSLKNKDRVTGLSIHRTITAVGGVVGALVAAYIITVSGGLESADSFNPLFLFQFALNVMVFILLWRLHFLHFCIASSPLECKKKCEERRMVSFSPIKPPINFTLFSLLNPIYIGT
jgi:hypothetical protein